tara:strand:+ start:110301 stop:110447 length:147 start_codon:yes stop_codon:yes gene_type:complete
LASIFPEILIVRKTNTSVAFASPNVTKQLGLNFIHQLNALLLAAHGED